MSDSNSLVSVIMPAYNSGETLDQSVESVALQVWKDWELIIVVDRPTDDTAERAHLWAQKDQRIHVIDNPENIGAALSRNTGIRHANGRYIAFLDSDDTWAAEKLAIQVPFMRSNHIRISYTVYRRFVPKTGKENIVVPPLKISLQSLLRTNSIAQSSAIYDRDGLEDLRFQNVGHEDYLFWLTALAKTGEAWRVPEETPLMNYRVGGDSVSSQKMKAAMWQWSIYRQHLNLSVVKSAYLFLYYMCAAFRKRRYTR